MNLIVLKALPWASLRKSNPNKTSKSIPNFAQKDNMMPVCISKDSLFFLSLLMQL